MKMRSTRFLFLLAGSFLFTTDGLLALRAETRTAAGLTPEAVWDAINASQDGDIVRLPEGTAVWKSGWNTGHWAKMKAITIQGAGIDKTIIRDETSTAAGDEPFDLQGSGRKAVPDHRHDFRRDWPAQRRGLGRRDRDQRELQELPRGPLQIPEHGSDDDDQWRHLWPDRPLLLSRPGEESPGSDDLCAWDRARARFTRPLTLGTAEAVYFEDNEAHFSPEVVNATGNNPWIVPYEGARVVIRHNKIINTQLEIYRVRPGAYGSQSAEIYENTFSAEGVKMGRPQGFIFISGGVAMVFNNTVTGTTYNTRTIQISHERSFQADWRVRNL